MTMLPLVYIKITIKQHHGVAGQWVHGGALLEKFQSPKKTLLEVVFGSLVLGLFLVPTKKSLVPKKSLPVCFQRLKSP